MATLKDRLVKRVLGDTDIARSGVTRTWHGLRERDRREFALGLVISGLAYLQRTKPRKTLIYRQEIKEGSAVVVRNTVPGQPKVEIENRKP